MTATDTDSKRIRLEMAKRWYESAQRLAPSGSGELHGDSPPSVFVGSYGYPKVMVGPLVPPFHGDTALLDAPERWSGKTLSQIVRYRMSLVRGSRPVPITSDGRYVQEMQEMAMSGRPVGAEIRFDGHILPAAPRAGDAAPFGAAGRVVFAKYFPSAPSRRIERAYYDRDLTANEAVLGLYDSDVPISEIQKCLSMGMLGRTRRLVPTRWGITAVDSAVSNCLVSNILDYSILDHYRVFRFCHLGNAFSVVLFPHRWAFEMTEAWYSGGVLGFGSDREDARRPCRNPSIAGAYFAAKLAVCEYLERNRWQAGALVLREIRPEYSVPVGVWQVREGVRQAMNAKPDILHDLDASVRAACSHMRIRPARWLERGGLPALLMQKTLVDYP